MIVYGDASCVMVPYNEVNWTISYVLLCGVGEVR